MKGQAGTCEHGTSAGRSGNWREPLSHAVSLVAVARESARHDSGVGVSEL